MEAENYVAKLYQYEQKTRSKLVFEDVGSVGPDHIKTFTIRAVLNGKAYPDGVGKNKKEAKHNAAKNALRGLWEEPTESTGNAADAPATPVHQSSANNINYICWLNEYCNSNRVNMRAVESTKLGANSAFHFMVGDKEYPVATGKNKKEAKEEAAKLVYNEINGSKVTETGDVKVASSQQDEESNQDVSNTRDSTKSPTVMTPGKDFTGINFIGLLNNYCQKTKRNHDCVFVDRCGQPHNQRFFYKVVVNKKEYPVGEGKTVKEAKQSAAQLALSALQESDWDNKDSAVSDDAIPARRSTPPSTPVPTTLNSVLFTNSSPPLSDQIQSPGGKPKIRIAANFQNARGQSKEDWINFNGKNVGNNDSKKQATLSLTSRFTSEFDSIVRLGKGGFGRVFKARQKLLDKDFAVKVVCCKKKALREVAALSDLNHCNIVRYYHCWLEDSGYQWDSTSDSCSSSQSTGDSGFMFLYIQMELCDTKTLKVWIEEKNLQNVKKSLQDFRRREESLSIAQQIVSGVEYIHSMKLIHRDLKVRPREYTHLFRHVSREASCLFPSHAQPANIMFGKAGEVKIGDFGLVTDENDDDAENLVERSMYKGTPSYMAPEQAVKRRRVTYDRKVDIFALGLIYFELLWNLFTVHERKAVWDDVRNQKFPEGFSHNFSLETQIIKSMLSEKPEDRPEARKLKKDLEDGARIFKEVKDSRCDNRTF